MKLDAQTAPTVVFKGKAHGDSGTRDIWGNIHCRMVAPNGAGELPDGQAVGANQRIALVQAFAWEGEDSAFGSKDAMLAALDVGMVDRLFGGDPAAAEEIVQIAASSPHRTERYEINYCQGG